MVDPHALLLNQDSEKVGIVLTLPGDHDWNVLIANVCQQSHGRLDHVLVVFCFLAHSPQVPARLSVPPQDQTLDSATRRAL